MSRGHAPRVDAEGSLGRDDKRWGRVRAVEGSFDALIIDGTEFDPAGQVVETVGDLAATTEIDGSKRFQSAAPTSDTTFTFANTTDALEITVLVQGDAGEYTIAFPAGVKWKTKRPDQLVNGEDFLFRFVAFGGVIQGEFIGTFQVDNLTVFDTSTALVAAADVETFVVEQRCQIQSVDLHVDEGADSSVDFAVRRNGSSIFTTAPSIATGDLSTAQTGTSVLDRAKRVMEAGDVIEFDVAAVGTPTPANGLKIRIVSLILGPAPV